MDRPAQGLAGGGFLHGGWGSARMGRSSPRAARHRGGEARLAGQGKMQAGAGRLDNVTPSHGSGCEVHGLGGVRLPSGHDMGEKDGGYPTRLGYRAGLGARHEARLPAGAAGTT